MRTTNPAKVGGLESTESVTLTGNGKVKCVDRLPMEDFRRGVSSPTAAIRAGVAGFLFDADAEILYVQFCVPTDWDATSDMTLVIHCVLNADGTANDKIDWETSIVSIADHEDVDTAGTQTPGVEHDIGAVVGAGSFHKVPIIIDYDSGTCPLALGDNISITLSRTANVGAAGYVAGVIVIDICVMYQANKLGEAV
ncbi:hypothetical protein KKE60_05870 [Patescibacteria group bacterium]|nr:hypothetical protein [Patescibacteria group bacterium]